MHGSCQTRLPKVAAAGHQNRLKIGRLPPAWVMGSRGTMGIVSKARHRVETMMLPPRGSSFLDLRGEGAKGVLAVDTVCPVWLIDFRH